MSHKNTSEVILLKYWCLSWCSNLLCVLTLWLARAPLGWWKSCMVQACLPAVPRIRIVTEGLGSAMTQTLSFIEKQQEMSLTPLRRLCFCLRPLVGWFVWIHDYLISYQPFCVGHGPEKNQFNFGANPDPQANPGMSKILPYRKRVVGSKQGVFNWERVGALKILIG